MEALVQKLVLIMARLVDEHKALLRDGEAHQRALIVGDTVTIASSVEAITKRVDQIHHYEQQRHEAALEIGNLLGISHEKINISLLAQHLDAEDMEELLRLSSELEQVIVQLVRVNELNRSLVEQSMRYLHKSVELVANAMSQDAYGTGGKPVGGGHLLNVQA